MNRTIAPTLGACLCVILGAIWIYFGLAKALDLIVPSEASAKTWSAQFSPVILWAVTLAELCLGVLLTFRPARSTLLPALTLLGLFAAAFVLWPLQPQQSCGCAGASGAALGLDSISPFVRLAALGAMHLLALALMSNAKPRAASSTTQPA